MTSTDYTQTQNQVNQIGKRIKTSLSASDRPDLLSLIQETGKYVLFQISLEEYCTCRDEYQSSTRILVLVQFKALKPFRSASACTSEWLMYGRQPDVSIACKSTQPLQSPIMEGDPTSRSCGDITCGRDEDHPTSPVRCSGCHARPCKAIMCLCF